MSSVALARMYFNQSINHLFAQTTIKTYTSIQPSRAGQPRSHKSTDSCPEKECSMTIIQFIITQNYRQENEKSLRLRWRWP